MRSRHHPLEPIAAERRQRDREDHGGDQNQDRAGGGSAGVVEAGEDVTLHQHRHAPLASYSKGMKQRVLISGALLHDPEILVFDEPLSGLDVSSALLFKHLVAELAARGKIILYISHVLEVVEKVCAKVIIIYRGNIMAEDRVSRLRDLMQLPWFSLLYSPSIEELRFRLPSR